MTSMELFWYCFVGAVLGLGALSVLAAGTWQVAWQIKQRNLLENMRIDFEAKRAGWTDAQWLEFRLGWYEVIRQANTRK